MAELRSRGVAFALDDFGIGSSSFENIIEAQIKYLKIDKSFVRSIGRDPRRVLMLDGLIELA
jgi:EAL domain-containing protein (putative c-di-GMP-specific phosphodiesterase class I)